MVQSEEKNSQNAEENVEIGGLNFWNFAINLIKEFSDFKTERYVKLKKKQTVLKQENRIFLSCFSSPVFGLLLPELNSDRNSICPM